MATKAKPADDGHEIDVLVQRVDELEKTVALLAKFLAPLNPSLRDHLPSA